MLRSEKPVDDDGFRLTLDVRQLGEAILLGVFVFPLGLLGAVLVASGHVVFGWFVVLCFAPLGYLVFSMASVRCEIAIDRRTVLVRHRPLPLTRARVMALGEVAAFSTRPRALEWEIMVSIRGGSAIPLARVDERPDALIGQLNDALARLREPTTYRGRPPAA